LELVRFAFRPRKDTPNQIPVHSSAFAGVPVWLCMFKILIVENKTRLQRQRCISGMQGFHGFHPQNVSTGLLNSFTYNSKGNSLKTTSYFALIEKKIICYYQKKFKNVISVLLIKWCKRSKLYIVQPLCVCVCMFTDITLFLLLFLNCFTFFCFVFTLPSYFRGYAVLKMP